MSRVLFYFFVLPNKYKHIDSKLNSSLTLDYSKTSLPESTDINTFLQTILERLYPNEIELVSITSLSDWYCASTANGITKTSEKVRANIGYKCPLFCLKKVNLYQGTNIHVEGHLKSTSGETMSIVLVAGTSTNDGSYENLTETPYYTGNTELTYTIDFTMLKDIENAVIGCYALYGDNSGHFGDVEINRLIISQ